MGSSPVSDTIMRLAVLRLYFRFIEPPSVRSPSASRGVLGHVSSRVCRNPIARSLLMIALGLYSIVLFATPSVGAAGSNWTGRWIVVLTCSRPVCPLRGYFDLVQSGKTIKGELNGVIRLTSGTASGSTAILAYDYGAATEYYRLTMSSDGARFTGSNTIVTSSGETEDVGIVTGTRAGDDTLSVSDATQGVVALSADVKVSLKSSFESESGCDEKVVYDFTDADLLSAKKVAPCEYQLIFNSPGTGIYHVGLKAKISTGAVIPVTMDQYGESVDGKFTLIIDS